MMGYPSKVLVIADYKNANFIETIDSKIDFVLSCGDFEFHILKEIYERFKKPIFAIKGNNDSTAPFPEFVREVHFKVVQHRNWFIGGWQGIPSTEDSGPYLWDDAHAAFKLSKFPYVDIFICHASVYKLTDEEDSGHQGSEAILSYIKEKQPKYVYHGHVHSQKGAMVGKTAVMGISGAKVFTLS